MAAEEEENVISNGMNFTGSYHSGTRSSCETSPNNSAGSRVGSGGSATITPMTRAYDLQEGYQSLPRRPGTLITPEINPSITLIPVMCNSFPVTLDEGFDCDIVKYDVIFDPPIQEDARDRERILEQNEQTIRSCIGDHALDNARIYAWKPINWDDARDGAFEPAEIVELQYEFADDRGRIDRKLILQAGQKKPLMQMDNQYQQQVLSVLLRELCREVGLLRMGRNHYDLNSTDRQVQWDGGARAPLQRSLMMMDGFRMSLEYTCSVGLGEPNLATVSLTIDACSRVLDPNSAQDLIDQVLANSNAPREFRKKIREELKYRAVVTDYNNKIFKIDDIAFFSIPSEQLMNDPETMEEMTVQEFYNRKYPEVDVQDTQAQVLFVHEMAARKRDQGRKRKLYLIPSLCKLTGYPPSIRKKHDLMKRLSRKNKLPSDVRADKCLDCAEKLAQAAESTSSPLRINPSIQVIMGKVLSEAPMYLNKKSGGVESLNITQLQSKWKKFGMFDSLKLGDGEWVMIVDEKHKKKKEKLYKNMKKEAENIGGSGTLGKPEYIIVQRGGSVHKAWEDALRKKVHVGSGIRAVVAVLNTSAQPSKEMKQKCDLCYEKVKLVCSKDAGVHSQCIQSCNLDTNHVWIGITRQLFTKLGALPWKLRFLTHTTANHLNLRIPTMLVGIDVNHDRKEANAPIAFVSTWDRDFVRTHAQLGYHTLANEVMNQNEMTEFMTNALENFNEKNRRFPEQIIVYRDGIASTQIKHVLQNEMLGVDEAFERLGIEPKVEFILVNKRVNCRFVELETKENVPRGLVVDDTIVSSQYWDFYITPADAPEGCTSTPTRFIIIRDDLKLSARNAALEIEAFTRQCCNLYYNWPGPVRVPHIVKNADKLTTQFGAAVNGEHPHVSLANSYHYL